MVFEGKIISLISLLKISGVSYSIIVLINTDCMVTECQQLF
jgi:hypothetical protein